MVCSCMTESTYIIGGLVGAVTGVSCMIFVLVLLHEEDLRKQPLLAFVIMSAFLMAFFVSAAVVCGLLWIKHRFVSSFVEVV